MNVLYMLPPGEGIKGLKHVILETVVGAGGSPCPPIVLNLGIGGISDLALKNAKLAMMRPLGIGQPGKVLSKLENELLELVDATGIGPM
jgi:fumarate hydratase subunit alpha